MSSAVRAGFIVPSINVVLEDELRRHFPAQVEYNVARVPLTGGMEARAQLASLPDAVVAESGKLIDAGVDVIAVACMAASVMNAGFDTAMPEAARSRTGLDMLTAGNATFAALDALGGRTVGLITPYAPWLHEVECDYLRRRGYRVVDNRLDIYAPDVLGQVPGTELSAAVAAAARSLGPVDVVVVSCANARLLSELIGLHEDLEVPVLSTNQMIGWAVLQRLAVPVRGTPWALTPTSE